MIQVNYDLITVLSSCDRALLTTKTHHRRRGGEWKSEQYGNVFWWRSSLHVVDSFDAMASTLSALENDPCSCVIRDTPREDTNTSRARRRIAEFKPQDHGLRMLGIDIDDLMVADVMGQEMIDTSAEGLLEAVNAVINHICPALNDCSVFYQWSSSAGIKSWDQYRLHLWFYLDRPVFRSSLKEWAKRTNGVDPSLYDSVHVHYTSAPVIKNMHGSQMLDLFETASIEGPRSGIIKKQKDTSTALDSWLSRGAWEAKDAASRATQDRLNRINAKRQVEAMRRKGGVDRVKDIARRKLNTIALSIVNELPGTGRHDHVRAKCRASFGMRDLIPAHEIAQLVMGYASTALSMSGRSASQAASEAKRLIDPLINDTRGAPAFPLSERDLESAPHRPTMRSQKDSRIGVEYLTSCISLLHSSPEDGPRWSEPDEGWFDESTTPLTLEGGHAWLDTINRLATKEGTLVAVQAPAGSGKSFAAKKHALINMTRATDGRAQLIVPTHALAHEAVEDLNEMAKTMGSHDWRAVAAASRRGPDANGNGATCHDYESIVSAAQGSPNGSIKVCHACKHYPSTVKESGEGVVCPYYLATKVEQVADVVVKTHARFVLQTPDSADPFEMQVIDEDPTGSMISTSALSLRDVRKMVLDGDLEAPKAELDAFASLVARSFDQPIEADTLRAELDLFAWNVKEAYLGGQAATVDALKETLPDERRARFGEAIPWRSIAGLREVISDGWGVATIKDGRLNVTHTIKLDLSGAKRTMYLDATCTERRSSALLGEASTFERLRVEMPSSARVKWLPLDLGVGSRLHKEGARRQPVIYASIVSKYMRPGTLFVTSKRNRDLETWTGSLFELAEKAGADVIHHKGAEGRGVNKYKDHHTIVIDPWHVPLSVIEQQAYALCKISGDDWSQESTRATWRAESRAKLLSAEILQEIARIRPLSSTEDRPVEIIIIDKRDPRSLGLPIDEVIDPDELAFSELKISTGWNTASSIMGRVVERCQGAFLPTVDLRSLYPMRSCDIYPAIRVERQIHIINDVLRIRQGVMTNADKTVASIVMDAAKNHGGHEELARASRCGFAWVYVDGHKPLPMYYRGAVSRVVLELRLRSAGFNRYRMSPDDAWSHLDVIDKRLSGAVAEMVRINPSTRTLKHAQVIDQMVSMYSITKRQARAITSRYRSPDESLDEMIMRHFSALMMDRAKVTAHRLASILEVSIEEAAEMVSIELGFKISGCRSLDDPATLRQVDDGLFIAAA